MPGLAILKIFKDYSEKKPIYFFQKKTNFESFEKSEAITLLETNSRKKLPHLTTLKNFKVFFQKNVLFSKKKPYFERFETSYFSSRILRQTCYILEKKISR